MFDIIDAPAPRLPGGVPGRGSRAERGLTMAELMVSLVILTVCSYLLSQTIVSTVAQGPLKRERSIAIDAARGVLEDLRNVPFDQVFALYNAVPDDDPGGAGTGPGPNFAVDGLDPAPGDLDGLAGEVLFASPGPELREDAVEDRLGLPRDLDGDSEIDDADHAGDYRILPVRVRVAWGSGGNTREVSLYTMLADIHKQ